MWQISFTNRTFVEVVLIELFANIEAAQQAAAIFSSNTTTLLDLRKEQMVAATDRCICCRF